MSSIDSMSKQEFADYALTQDITLNISMTKAEMIDDYQKSLGVGSEEAPVVEAPVVEAPTTYTPEEIAAAEADVARLFAAAQAMNAEEERIANLPAEEQVELVQWTIEEAIGILRYAVSRGKK